jgi:hypothetical protein
VQAFGAAVGIAIATVGLFKCGFYFGGDQVTEIVLEISPPAYRRFLSSLDDTLNITRHIPPSVLTFGDLFYLISDLLFYYLSISVTPFTMIIEALSISYVFSFIFLFTEEEDILFHGQFIRKVIGFFGGQDSYVFTLKLFVLTFRHVPAGVARDQAVDSEVCRYVIEFVVFLTLRHTHAAVMEYHMIDLMCDYIAEFGVGESVYEIQVIEEDEFGILDHHAHSPDSFTGTFLHHHEDLMHEHVFQYHVRDDPCPSVLKVFIL